MDRLFGKKKDTKPVVEEVKPTAPTLGETSEKLDSRCKVIQTKVDD